MSFNPSLIKSEGMTALEEVKGEKPRGHPRAENSPVLSYITVISPVDGAEEIGSSGRRVPVGTCCQPRKQSQLRVADSAKD